MMNFHLDYSDMKRIIAEAAILVCFAFSVGLMFNHQLVMDAFEGGVMPTTLPAPESEFYPVPVALEDVKEMTGRVILVDARSQEIYNDGHLPGAVSLPLGELDQLLPTFMDKYPTASSLILYCSGYGCTDSFDMALVLLEKGYRDVMLFEGGYPRWRDAGLPVEEGTP